MAHSYTDWLSLDFREQLHRLGFGFLLSAQTKDSKYTVHNHRNGIHVITEKGEEERVYIIRDGFSIYLFDDQCLYAGSIIKANMDSDFAWCENPTCEIEDMLNTLDLKYLINN